MSFFKDFKEDFSDAVDELVPVGEDKTLKSNEAAPAADSSLKLDTNINPDEELSKLDGLLEKVAKRVDEQPQAAEISAARAMTQQQLKPAEERNIGMGLTPQPREKAKEFRTMENQTLAANNVNDNLQGGVPLFDSAPASDENAVITTGMKITGDLESTGSIEVEGTINGNVRCNGKLTVTGVIKGNTTSSEFFADSAKMEGEVVSSGTVKIGVGSVIVGNIAASSAVIAGAVKGDIDVQGPVVVDTSAVVMGNIKSRSVQINNGAVIEGFCSQSYADVDVESVFA